MEYFNGFVSIINKYKFPVFVISLLMIAVWVKASTYQDVGDEVYDILQRLEAEGVIKSGLLTTKPLSRKEVVRLIREAEENAEGRRPFIRSLIRRLKTKFKGELDGDPYVKPLDKVRATYIHAESQPSELSYNNEGDDYHDGSNFRLETISRAELGWLSLYVNPEFRYSDGDTDLIMNKVYGVVDVRRWELEIGTDSQWWGPGYHGALLLSNNPEPMPLIKLTNSHPMLLPWIFKHLGLFKFTTFVTRLEKDRDVSEPLLWGMRLNLKPSPYVEIGLQRTAMFGGQGYPQGLSTWWDVFRGKGDDDPNVPGDQRGGYDLTLTLPFDTQPLQVYAEADGEDEAGGLPSNYAFLYGIFFPRIVDFEKIGLRAEYANNHINGKPDAWYNHDVYSSGYTYKGRIIGHHMGTDSKDVFIEASYFLPEVNGRLAIAYDWKKHNLSDDVHEKKQEIYMTADMDLTESLRIKAEYGYGKIKNLDMISGQDKDINTFIIQLRYDF